MTGPVPPGGPLRLTTARWLNRRRRVRSISGEWTEKWSKVLAHNGPYEQFAYGTDTETTWTGHGFQRAIICSPRSGTIAVDVDHEREFKATRTGQIIGREHAISTRGGGFHVLVDARAVPPDQWPPKQLPIAGADVKSCGFIPMPGSWHYSRERYEPVFRPDGLVTVVTATPEHITAILADQADLRGKGNGHGGHGGGSGGGHDGEVAARTKGMIIRRLRAGWPVGPELKEDVYAEWLTVAVPLDPSWPFERADFERHYRGGQEDALKDFAAEQQAHAGIAWWIEQVRA